MRVWSSMKEKVIHILIIVGLGAAIYANSMDNLFVWHDWTLIIRNPLIRSWSNLTEILSGTHWKPLVGEPSYIYRPLVLMTFMTDYPLWLSRPWGYHLTNISIHLLNGVLVYLLLSKYLTAKAAFLGATLFVVHPVQTEAVTYISGRADPLMALFLLSGLVIFLHSQQRRSWLLYLASLPLFFLSLLAKETAIFFPLLVIGCDVCINPLQWRDRLPRYGGLLAPLALYLFMRRMAMGGELYLYEGGIHPLSTTLWFLKIIPSTLGTVFFPLNPHFPISEHRLYLPSLVLFALVAVAFHFLAGKVTVKFSALGIFLIGVLLGGITFLGLGVITFRHNSLWRDELILSQRALKAAPDDPVTLWLLGESYLPRGRSPEAVELFKKALTMTPNDPKIHESLGLATRLLKKHTEALVHYQRAAELTPNHPYYHWIAGRHYMRLKRFSEAEGYLRNAVRLNPRSSELQNELAYCYYIQGKNDAAIAQLKEALKILPYSPTLQSNLAQALKRKN